jgi:hypothetical protein
LSNNNAGYKKQHKTSKQNKPDVTAKLARVNLDEQTGKGQQCLNALTKQSTSKLPDGEEHG